MSYVVVDSIDISSPVQESLYELVSGSYILSADAKPVSGKTYYMLVEDEETDDFGYAEVEVEVGDDVTGLYEYDENEDDYFPTSDTTAQAGKDYYERLDQRAKDIPDSDAAQYYPLESEVSNPSAEGLYELVEGSYILTADATYNASKTYYRKLEPPSGTTVDDTDYAPVYSIDDVVPTGIKTDNTASLSNDFLFAYMEFVENPHAEGLYEIVNGVYVLTADTHVDESKTYYEYYHYSDYYAADMTGVTNPSLSLTNYYEVSGGSYVLTNDSTVVSGKTYYRSHREDLYVYRNDPSEGATPAEWDDIPYEE